MMLPALHSSPLVSTYGLEGIPLLLGEQLPPTPQPSALLWSRHLAILFPWHLTFSWRLAFHKQGFLPRKASNQCHSTLGCAGSGSWLWIPRCSMWKSQFYFRNCAEPWLCRGGAQPTPAREGALRSATVGLLQGQIFGSTSITSTKQKKKVTNFARQSQP